MIDLAASAAIGISLAALVWLARRDPKRSRLLGRRHDAAAAGPRRVATLIALAPGAALLLAAEWANLLVWAGSVLAAGWLLVQGLAVRDER